MTTKILLTSPRITPDSTILMQAASEVGQTTIRLPSFRPTAEIENKPIAVYGESLFAIIITTALGYRVIEPTADWLPNLPKQYTQRDIELTAMDIARQFTKPYFVKNADGMKAFEAKVYSSGTALPSPDYYDDDYALLVSEPVEWEVEYRCFVMEREVRTLSIYLRDGELAKLPDGTWQQNDEEMAEAKQFCEQLLLGTNVPIPPAVVIDVGRIAGRGWAVIEANPAYGAGIYGCDPKQVLQVVNRCTMAENDVSEDDKMWVVDYEVED